MLQLIVQADSCAETVEELGELGGVMFCDLNEGATAFQRNFVAQMRECDEVERCLRYVGEQVAAQVDGVTGLRQMSRAVGRPPTFLWRRGQVWKRLTRWRPCQALSLHFRN